MKRLATLIITLSFLFLIVGLIGCGGDSEKDTQIQSLPSIVYSFPGNGSTLVSITASIMLMFDEDISPPQPSNLIFTPGVSGSVSYNAETKSIIYKPDSVLAANTPYNLKVQGITSLTGASMTPVSIGFTTSTSDTSAPKVEFTSPEDGQENTGTSDSINIRFTEPINRVKFLNGIRFSPNIDLKSGENGWRFLWSTDNEKEINIIPPPGKASFELATEYTLIIPRENVEDMSGNKMVTDYMVSFETLRYAPEPVTSSDLNTPNFVALKDPPFMFSVGKYGPNNWIIVWTAGMVPPGGSGTGSGTVTASGNGEIQGDTVQTWVSHDGAGYSIPTSVTSGKGNRLNFNTVGGTDYYARLKFSCTSSYVIFSLGTSNKYIYLGSKGVNPSQATFVLSNK